MNNDPHLTTSAAARLVVGRARGGGTPDSKCKRLVNGYLQFFQNQPPEN